MTDGGDRTRWGLRAVKISAIASIAGVAAVVIAARRERVSVRGWFVAHAVVPALYGRARTAENFTLAIADDRARGPALPSAKIRSRYAFTDRRNDGGRVFRLAPNQPSTIATRVLYLHGGAYVFDLMPVQWPVVTAFVDQLTAEVVVPLYPLAPESNVDAALEAVEIHFLQLVAEVGAKNIVLIGDSAGGGLALALAQRLRDRGKALPATLILFFPWLDVTCSGEDQAALIAHEPLLSVDELRTAGRMWAGTGDPTRAPASPLFADQAGLPPTITLVGTRDMLLSDSRRLVMRNPEILKSEYPGMFHGWICAPIPEAYDALNEATAFARRHLGVQ